MVESNWCEICQEVCHDHPTMCSVCGAPLTEPPPSDATIASSGAMNLGSSREEQLLHDMRQASRDLQSILGNLRGQVQDLDVLTRNILDGDDNNTDLPQEAWDPQQANSSSRPTSKEALNKMTRFVLHEHSSLFRQSTLIVSTDLISTGVSSTAPLAGLDTDSQQLLLKKSTSQEICPSSSDISSVKNFRKIDCTLGEFGSAEEYDFEMGTYLVVASPFTGKGGLDRETKARISQLKARHNNVILFLKRGDGLTFVQKARMAQDAGASAVVIGNNTPTPWPYVMKDSKGESKKPEKSISIPVAMIKEEESKRIMQQFEKKKDLKRKRIQLLPPIPNQIYLGKGPHQQQEQLLRLQQTLSQDSFCDIQDWSLSSELMISAQSTDCPVCCEQMKTGETVIQLPGCGHIFHEACALAWLKSHNTCPYCRRELPTDDPVYEEERRRRQQQQQEQTVGSGNEGSSFYR